MQGQPPVSNTRFSGDPFLEGPRATRQLVHESVQQNAAIDLTDEPPRYSEESQQPLLPFSLPKAPEVLEGPRRGKWAATWMPPSAGPFDTLVSATPETVIHHEKYPVPKYYHSFMQDERLDQFLQGQPFWLLLYFFFNLALTLFNKMVLVKFPFPYTLTAIHALFGSIGCYILHERGVFVRPPCGVVSLSLTCWLDTSPVELAGVSDPRYVQRLVRGEYRRLQSLSPTGNNPRMSFHLVPSSIVST